MLCEERLRALGLSSWERRRLRGDPAALCYVLRWGSAEGSAGLCSLITTGRIPGKGTKLCQGRFRLGSRKYFFTVRGWSNTGTGFLVRWPMPHAWQRSRGNWKMPSLIHFNFWLAWRYQAFELADFLKVLSRWTIVWHSYTLGCHSIHFALPSHILIFQLYLLSLKCSLTDQVRVKKTAYDFEFCQIYWTQQDFTALYEDM